MWALGVERWRDCKGLRALHDSAHAVIHCKAVWQWRVEWREERCHNDTSRADFFDSRWWESYWRRIEISKLLKNLEDK